MAMALQFVPTGDSAEGISLDISAAVCSINYQIMSVCPHVCKMLRCYVG